MKNLYYNLYGDGMHQRDLRDYRKLPLESLGIYENKELNELFFLVPAGGYGDIIRSVYYAGELAKIHNKCCKVIFACPTSTKFWMVCPPNVKKKASKWKKGKEVWNYRDDAAVVRNVLKELNLPDNVKFSFIHTREGTVYDELTNSHLTRLLAYQRNISVSQWLGFPDLEPKRESKEGDYIAVWTTELNRTPVRKEKDPVGWHTMEMYLKKLEKNGHKLKRISYRDTGKKIFETIANAKMCIGYEGMGNVISRIFRKPIIVFSGLPYLSRVTSGQWAHIVRDVEPELYEIDSLIELQKEIIEESVFGGSRDDKPMTGFNKEETKYFGELNEII